MAEDLSKAAGRGVDVELDGKSYCLNPLTMGDLADFQAYVRSQRLKVLKDNMDGLPADQQANLILSIINTPVDGEQMEREMETSSGFRFLMWKSLGKSQPDLTIEAVGDMLSTQNVVELLPVIQGISGLGEDEGNPPAEGE